MALSRTRLPFPLASLLGLLLHLARWLLFFMTQLLYPNASWSVTLPVQRSRPCFQQLPSRFALASCSCSWLVTLACTRLQKVEQRVGATDQSFLFVMIGKKSDNRLAGRGCSGQSVGLCSLAEAQGASRLLLPHPSGRPEPEGSSGLQGVEEARDLCGKAQDH